MLQLRPETHAAAVAVPAVEEMTPADDVPLMRLDDLSALERMARELAPGLAVRRIEPRDARLHAEIAAAGFGEELDFFVRLLPPATAPPSPRARSKTASPVERAGRGSSRPRPATASTRRSASGRSNAGAAG